MAQPQLFQQVFDVALFVNPNAQVYQMVYDVALVDVPIVPPVTPQPLGACFGFGPGFCEDTMNQLIVFNAQIPKEGPRAVPFSFDFRTNSVTSLDLLTNQQQGGISMIQSIYIDNSVSTGTLTVIVGTTNQVIVAPPQSQGFYNVLASGTLRLAFSQTTGANVVNMFLINVMCPASVWKVT